jgi:hypothetical protein
MPSSDEWNEGSKDDLLSKIRRWDDIRRAQFGVALTTFTALATGGLGYCGKLISQEHIFFPAKSTKYCFIGSAIMFGVGLLCGVTCTLTRLLDSRWTAKKHHRQKDGAASVELDRIKKVIKRYENATWTLLYVLTGMVFLGVVCLVFCLYGLYGFKLE